MSKHKDASTCDERQVKNKPNRLTQKRKGETRRMSSESMKHWKVSLFFVISLMLVAGLFADTASAQTSTLEVTTVPSVVKAEETLRSVTVTYTLTGLAAGATELASNAVAIGLPVAVSGTNGVWTAAYANDGVPGGTVGFGELPSTTGTIDLDGDSTATPAVDPISMVSSRNVNASARISSYVTVTYTTTDTSSDTTATAAISGTVVTVTPDEMVAGDKIIVTFYNVKVGTLDIAAVNLMRDPVDVSLVVTDSGVSQTPDEDAFAAEVISVNPRKISTVSVDPMSVKADSTTDVYVTYIAEDDLSRNNTVTIALPSGWQPAYTDAGVSATIGTSTTNTDGTFGDTARLVGRTITTLPATMPTGKSKADFSYIEVSSSLDLAAATTAATNRYLPTITQFDSTGPTAASIVLTPEATASMMERRDRLTVTFFNVRIQTVYDQTPIKAQASVTDTGVTGPATKYNARTVFTVQPPSPSVVTVNPTAVNASSEIDLVVLYTVDDTLYTDNGITVELPPGWDPARPHKTTETTNSFGDTALTEAPPSRDRARTSYVLVEKSRGVTLADGDSDTANGITIDIVKSNADAEIRIDTDNSERMLQKGDWIRVTFNNVMVPQFLSATPEDVLVTVLDDIPGSDYDASTMVEVMPPKLGSVTVTPKEVFAESMVDLKVRYTATGTLADGSSTYGRIRVQLPKGWGPEGDIELERPVGTPNATYLSLAKSSGVTLKAVTGDPDGLGVEGTQAAGHIINIDVDKMTTRHQVTLTIHNLMIDELMTPREERHMDITAAMAADKVQVMVTSSTYASAGARNVGDPTHAPRTFSPKIAAESETQPTITVKRKELGSVTVAPNSVTAGSKRDFTITYKATEKLNLGDVIEITLPANWPAPTHYNFNVDGKHEDVDGTLLTDALKAAKDTNTSHPHVYLSGSATRLEGAMVDVIDGSGGEATVDERDSDGWIVQITLGENGVSKNGTIVLKYYDVTVQRALAKDPKLVIETFSGMPKGGLPQYPVVKMAEDTIEVKEAADGSGTVKFEYESDVTSMSGKDSDGDPLVSNTSMSIPAGLTKDDLRELVVTYTPAGDMGAGGGEFEFRLPSDWKAEDVRVSQGTKEVSGNTVTVDFDPHFGEAEGDMVEITFADITVPNNHGEVGFTAKSKNAGGTLRQLSPRPMAFVGNVEATHDTVGVTITPAAAYENWDDVDFEIELTNAGPMHDSQIRITVPEGLFGLQTDKPAEENYVKMISTSARSVRLSTLDIIDEDIVISTGKLNENGRIRVRFDNVNLKDNDVSTDAANGFRVGTRTRGDGPALTDLDYADLDDVAYVEIQKADGGRSISGGLIRTIAGSGTMMVEVMGTGSRLVEQNARDQTIKLTYTAATNFTKKNLVIQMPSVIETELQETTASGKGHVSTTTPKFDASIKAADRLKISGSQITWTGVTLRRDQTFVTIVKRVDLLEYTGDFPWDTSLDGASLPGADNKPMVVVGTTAEDVAFRIVENGGVAVLAPSYPAASKQSIRFQFTAENTTIQPGGRLRFTVPGRWTMPSVTDRAGRATVSIVSEDADGNEILVSQIPKTGEADAGSKMVLSAAGRNVTVTMGAKGGLAEDASVTIQYGTADLTKFPVQIPASVAGTADNLADGLGIHGSYRVSGDTSFRSRSAGTVWVDVTNVEDGTGTVSVSPMSVRASSTDNLIRITYMAAGTMNGGAVHLIIPDDWGAAQKDDKTAANYVKVTPDDLPYEVLNSGRSVEVTLTTFGEGDTVMFSYGDGAGANKGAAAQAEIGEAMFVVESRGSSGGDFMPITDADSVAALTIEVKGAASGSGVAAVSVVKNKAGEADGQINAGDDKTYLMFTYTAQQSIAEGELEFTVPMGWTAPQQEDTNRPGYTYLEEGNALVSEEEYNGQVVTATIAMDAGNVIKIHYGWYATENGGAHAPDTAGTSVFGVKFDGSAVAMQPSVIVHGGTPSKLMVDAPATVSADPGADPVAITVEIQDDTDAATVMDSDLAVTLSSTSSTGSFTDADGEAIANNMITISAGMTEATAYYSDTTVGTWMLTASAVGLASDVDPIEVTTDIDRVDADSISVSPATATAGDTVTVTADGTAGRTATFSVGTVVTDGSMTESPAGTYTGTFTVVVDSHDGTHDVTVTIGAADPVTVEDAVTIDTTAPVISSASASPATVGNGDMVTISATVTGATSVTADVSALDDTQTAAVPLTMANGSYSASVTISADNAAANGAKTITVTAMDAAGNSAMSTAMVTLDNKLSYTSTIPAGTVLFHVPLDVEGLDTIGDLKEEIGSAVTRALVRDTASGSWNSRPDDVAITADLGIILIMSEAASVTFEGQAWGDGASSLSLGQDASNLVGLPVNDSRVTNISDIIGLFAPGVVTGITVPMGANNFAVVTAAGVTGDGPVMGDAAYLISATSAATVALLGTGWSNGDAATAPMVLPGHNVDGQTAVLDVSGAVVDEITGLASEGFRVKVKNLSTKASLTKVTSAEIVDGYNMTFVDLKAGNAARIGDVLEISADSPNPLVGVKPVRHVVTVDDVKNSFVMLENLIAYEIPAETALLRNYPNPFNPETWIPYHLSEDADVSLTIYDVNGALVRTIDVGHQIAAKYDTRSKAVYWDGRNQFGEQVASGIYFYSLSAGDFSATRKMVILK